MKRMQFFLKCDVIVVTIELSCDRIGKKKSKKKCCYQKNIGVESSENGGMMLGFIHSSGHKEVFFPHFSPQLHTFECFCDVIERDTKPFTLSL